MIVLRWFLNFLYTLISGLAVNFVWRLLENHWDKYRSEGSCNHGGSASHHGSLPDLRFLLNAHYLFWTLAAVAGVTAVVWVLQQTTVWLLSMNLPLYAAVGIAVGLLSGFAFALFTTLIAMLSDENPIISFAYCFPAGGCTCGVPVALGIRLFETHTPWGVVIFLPIAAFITLTVIFTELSSKILR